jgi:hypothetical protein
MKKPVSSFGLPDNVKKAMADREQQKSKPQVEQQAQQTEQEPAPELSDQTDASKDKPVKRDPEKEGFAILKEIGVDFNETDFHNYLFRGHITKEVVISKTSSMVFSATVKTLTSNELNLADGLLAEDIDNLKMTRDGMLARRSIWYLSFGLQALVDKPITKQIYKDDAGKELDLVAMAKERQEVIVGLAPGVTDKLIRMQAALTSALNLLIENKDTLFLNNTQAPGHTTGE